MSNLPPLGWYTDPTNPEAKRFWDGRQWTGLTRPAHETAPMPEAPARAVAAPTAPVDTNEHVTSAPAEPAPVTTSQVTAVKPTSQSLVDTKRPWLGEQRAQVGLLVGVVLLVAAAAMAIGGGDENEVRASSPNDRPARPTTSTTTSTTTTTEPSNPVESREFTSNSGYPYYVEVEVEGPDPTGSASVDTDSHPISCVGTARPGETNLWFRVSVTNLLDDREAHAPSLTFDTNLTDSYNAQQKEVLSVEERLAADFSTYDLSIIGNSGPPFRCGNSLFPPTDETIPAGGTREYVGIVGQLTDPVPDGIVLLITGAGATEPWIVPLTETT